MFLFFVKSSHTVWRHTQAQWTRVNSCLKKNILIDWFFFLIIHTHVQAAPEYEPQGWRLIKSMCKPQLIVWELWYSSLYTHTKVLRPYSQLFWCMAPPFLYQFHATLFLCPFNWACPPPLRFSPSLLSHSILPSLVCLPCLLFLSSFPLPRPLLVLSPPCCESAVVSYGFLFLRDESRAHVGVKATKHTVWSQLRAFDDHWSFQKPCKLTV